jgi:large subunit ribosomal protein L16
MFLQPKKFKFKKHRKGRIKQSLQNKPGFKLKYGSFGLIALEKGKITGRQIEAVRRTLTNYTKRQIKI